MQLALLAQAAGMFAATNIDDILVLAVFFGQAGGRRATIARIWIGQYLGFIAILVASVLGASGAGLLPEQALPYLGLLPLAIGVRAAIQVFRHRHDTTEAESVGTIGSSVWAVALVTVANGGDNIGVYVPVFAGVGVGGMVVYCAVFLLLLAVLIAMGWFLATRKPVAVAIARWGHVVLPVVLIGIGLFILIEGGAFGIPTAH